MMRRGCPSDYHCMQARGLTGPRHLRQSSSSNLGIHLLQCFPCWISPLLALFWLSAYLLDSLLTPHRKKGTAPPVAHMVITTTTGPMSTPESWRLGVNAALHRVMRTCPHCHWSQGPALNHKGRNLPVPLPVQPR